MVADLHDSMPMPDDPDMIDDWIERESSFTIYDESLESDSGFYNYWYVPARLNGLVLIENVYEHGLAAQEEPIF